MLTEIVLEIFKKFRMVTTDVIYRLSELLRKSPAIFAFRQTARV